MQYVMWGVAIVGIVCVLLVARRRFLCSGCHGDGFVSDTVHTDGEAIDMSSKVYEDQACPLCDGGKWMKYRRCPRCVGRGRIHKGATQTVTCPVCKGTGRLKLTAGAWLSAIFGALVSIVLLLAAGCITGFLLWGLWDFIQKFAIEAGMMG